MRLTIQPVPRTRFLKAIPVIGSVVFICFSLGMSKISQESKSPFSQESSTRISIEQALADLKTTYESHNFEGLIDILDNNYEGRLEFQSSLQDYFLSHKDLTVNFVIDTVLKDKDQISVRLHWYKNIMDNSGVLSKSQGSSQFVFKQYPEGLKLFYIRQDNPFF